MKKKLLSLFLVLVMVLGMFPVSAMAAEGAETGGYVYLSISFDGKYINDKNKKPIVYRAIPMSEIESIDLTEYGLDDMLYDGDGDGNYDTSALQLIIYAHENLYGGDWSEVNFDAIPGSSYFKGGVFGFTENLMYFHNGGFPVDWEQTEMYGGSMIVGATSDRIILNDGDFLDIASFSCFSFLWDLLGGFHAFADVDVPVDEDGDGYYDGEYRYDYTVAAGETLSFKLIHTFANLMSGQAALYLPEEYEVYYGKVFGEAEGSVFTDGEGNAEIEFPAAGIYYIWCDGSNGDESLHSTCEYCMETGEPCIVSAPAYARVTVTGGEEPDPEQPEEPECEHEWKDATCTAPKTCSKCGDTEDEANGHTWTEANCTTPKTCTVCKATEGEANGHDWNNGVCTKCETDCEHSWVDATCTAPKTCSVCNTTEGEVGSHHYVNGDCVYCDVSIEAQDVSEVLNATMEQLATTVTEPSFGTTYGEWTVFSLARGNYFEKGSKYFADYYTRILAIVDQTASAVNKNGVLDNNKSTENSRLIMALSSIGIDSTAVGSWDLVKAYSANGFNWIRKQGINGTIWTLIALDSGNYETSDPTIRQQCVDSLLSLRHNDGGWSLINNKAQPSNVDITGMTLVALYPYRDQPEVAAACEEALTWLSESQLETGGFPYGTGETSESCAWAIVAATTWGINPDTDSRFIKNGNSAVDNLLSYYIKEEAMFAHQGTAPNAMATDQACYALVAYQRYVNGENALYDMSDVKIEKSEEQAKRVESVTLDITELTIKVGETADLTATITPEDAPIRTVTWKSSDKKVAKVLDGKVTAVAEGTATITVTTKDGSKTATCTVTVVSPDKAAADAVSALIADIGVVTLDSKDAIIAARAAYDALADAQKALVANYAVLTAAEAALAALEADDKPVTPEEPENKTITVTMRLIGAELAKQDVDLGLVEYLPDYVTWIPTTTYTLEEGALVRDLWDMATEKAGIRSTGAAKNYVDTVWAPASLGGYALSEFTNGYRSGWMYTINGSHPGYGLCEQGLEDGDVVIWHYVNDYAYEVHDWFDEAQWPSLGDGSYYSFWLKALDSFGAKGGGIGSPSISGGTASDKEDEDKTEEEENKKEEPAISVKPEVSVNASGEAKTEISTETVSEVLEQITKEESTVLEIAPEITGEATKVEVELPAAALEKVVDSGVDLKVSTPVADIKLPTEAVSGLAEQKGALSVSASANEDGAVTVNISVGGETVNEISGGIVVGITAENISSSSVIVIVDENGNETVVKKSVADENGLAAMLNGSATIKIVDNKQEFTDTEGHWGEKGIDFASSHGLFSGVGDGKFDPQGTMTRAMMAATLFRLEDAVATGDNKFGDVPTDTWYTDAVIWAHESNIVSGTGDGFDPEGNITREQMAAMFYRYANMLGMDTSISGDTSKFSDNDKVSSWAQNAMEWAVGVGLIHGKGEDNLDPTGNATRAEVAAIYQRMIALIVK